LYSDPRILWRAGKYLVLAATLALAGCAANNTKNQYAQLSSTHELRDTYLSRTQADPLGAYINDEDSDAIDDDTKDILFATSSRSSTVSVASPGASRAFASTALNFLGIKYRYGGTSPKSGFDCSGLVNYAAEKSLGLKLPRSSAGLAREGESVPRDELRKGDLVFFNTLGRRYSHVGIYLGDHKFVHAPHRGSVVRIEDMNETYWKKHYTGARRLVAYAGKLDDAKPAAASRAGHGAAPRSATHARHSTRPRARHVVSTHATHARSSHVAVARKSTHKRH
jgi:cell wall-associated NlpC family hydrolase